MFHVSYYASIDNSERLARREDLTRLADPLCERTGPEATAPLLRTEKLRGSGSVLARPSGLPR